ncbi:hypothetical protein N9R78_00395 [Pelagibacteraceae bacterium]|nr:hypothetical protein [Pelagibacteraceae bacterium]
MATYCIFFFSINYALSASRYIIEDVLIHIDSSNTADIRNNAISRAQLAAYKRMIIPIIHPDDYNKIFPIDTIVLSSLVSGVELKEELILKDRYKANFTINFNPMKVREYFQKNEVTYSLTESKPISLIPIIYSKNNQINIENMWNEAWSKNNNNKDIFNLNIIKRLSLNNPMLSIEEFLALDLSDEPIIKNLNNNIFIWANYFTDTSNVTTLNIIIKNIFNQKIFTMTKNYKSLSNESDLDLINRSVKNLNQELFNTWVKFTSSLDSTMPYKFRFTNNQLKTWHTIEEKLLEIESIKKVSIDSYKIGNLKGTIYFSGDLDKLNLILLEYDIVMTYLGDYSDISLIKE